MSQSFKSPDGVIVIAQDDVQAAAFKNAGFEQAEEKPKRQPKE